MNFSLIKDNLIKGVKQYKQEIVYFSVLISVISISTAISHHVNATKQKTDNKTTCLTDCKFEQMHVPPVEAEEPEIVTAKVADEIAAVKSEISTLPEKTDVDLLALVTMAEAEAESEYGKRLVIDTILNRVDSPKFPSSISDVVYQPNQFTSMWNGRVDKCYIREDIRQLVIEEMKNRTNSEVIFFRTNHYSGYGTPLFQEGNHYFSKY